jgi:hypothetical protein
MAWCPVKRRDDFAFVFFPFFNSFSLFFFLLFLYFSSLLLFLVCLFSSLFFPYLSFFSILHVLLTYLFIFSQEYELFPFTDAIPLLRNVILNATPLYTMFELFELNPPPPHLPIILVLFMSSSITTCYCSQISSGSWKYGRSKKHSDFFLCLL